MPIYEFQCEACNESFEMIVKRGDETSFTCPACGSKNLRKLLSACAYIGGEKGSASSCAGCNATSCATCGK